MTAVQTELTELPAPSPALALVPAQAAPVPDTPPKPAAEDAPSLPKLWQYADLFTGLFERIAMRGGEMDTDLEKELDELNVAADEKVTQCVKFARFLESQSAAAKAEAKRCAGIASRFDEKLEWLRRYVKQFLITAGRQSAGGVLHNAALRKCGKPRITFVGKSVDELPPEFIRIVPEKREVNLEAVHLALKTNDIPPHLMPLFEIVSEPGIQFSK